MVYHGVSNVGNVNGKKRRVKHFCNNYGAAIQKASFITREETVSKLKISLAVIGWNQ